MAEINVNGIVKSFTQDRVVLDGITFSVDRGEHVGLLGGNGSGKTTLLRIITGELAPDRGSASVAPGRRMGYVAQLNRARAEETVEDVLRRAYTRVRELEREMERLSGLMAQGEDVSNRYDAALREYEAMDGYGWQTELDRVAGGLGIGPELRVRRFSELSGGEQTRVDLARLIMEKTDVLLLDEPTNHLDVESLEWLEDWLKHYKGTVLAVSHDRYFLDTVVGRIIELERGRANFYSGNYSYYVREKELRYRQQLLQYEKEQDKIRQLEFQIARLKAWGSVYDNPALHKRAAAMEKRIDRTRQTDRPVKESRMDAGFSGESVRADRVLQLEGLTKEYDGRTLFRDVTCEIRGGGEHVALLGGNGSGKTTLLRILTGEEQPDAGSFRFGPSVKAAYLPQQVVFAHPERTLYDTMLYETGCDPQEARDRLGAFRFSGEDVFKKVSELSGGERSRLRLCILMRSRVNLLILDEPTNHLDLASREWIEEAVSGFEGTLLFVSHDRYFIRRFADRVWELDGGRFTDTPGDYDRYRRIKALAAQQKQAESAARPEEPKREEPKPEKRSGGKDRAAERRLAVLEREIARREAELPAFEKRIELAASDYVELGRIEREREEFKAELDRMYREWEEAALKLEG